MVERISPEALDRLLRGKIAEEAICLVKFYSNECHYCAALKEDYEQLSERYEDIHFFAFNVKDVESLMIGGIPLNGVPTIYMFKTGPRQKIINLEDPKEPHDVTWYSVEYIRDFVERHRA